MTCTHPRCVDERGQAVPIVLGLMAVAMVVVLALLPLVQAAQQRAAARSAADAAALAGAAEGEATARQVAEENGAELVLWRTRGNEVWVEVTLGDAHAAAKARRED